MQDFISYKLKPWEHQPVHNIYVLTAVENGLVTGLTFLLLVFYFLWHLFKSFQKTKNKTTLGLIGLFTALFLVIGNLDHYLWDLYSGQVIMWISLGMLWLIVLCLTRKPMAPHQ